MLEGLRAVPGKEIDWEDYNYPPCLNVIHFTIADVDDEEARKAVRWAFASHAQTTVTLIANCCVTLVLAAGGVKGFSVYVLYSIFNFIIVSVLGVYALYHGYKGLATNNMRMTNIYLLTQVPVAAFSLTSAIASANNFNGWLNLKRAANENSSLSSFWQVWTGVEATSWSVGLVLLGAAYYLVGTHRRHGRPLQASASSSAPGSRL